MCFLLKLGAWWYLEIALICKYTGSYKGTCKWIFLLVKKLFANPLCQWLFARIHPNLGISIARSWSKHSRDNGDDEVFKGIKNEWLVQYCKEMLKKEEFDYFIFGHRHLPLQIKLNDKCTYINLGDWITNFTYAIFDGEKLELKKLS